ncbi:MAG: AAA family ATPase, partial [Tepidisphaeraceae bacterium]
VRRVLYRFPELLDAKEENRTDIYIVEGEKDVDRLRKIGLVATCNVGGAGKWRGEYSEALRGKDCIIIADKDDAGRKHAQQVAKSLCGIAASVKVIELPGDGVKDASDYVDAGGTADSLCALIDAAPPSTPNHNHESTNGDGRDTRNPSDDTPTAGPVLTRLSDVKIQPIHWWVKGIFPRKKVSLVAGDGGLGKSTVMIDFASRSTTGQSWHDGREISAGSVVMVNAEDDAPDTIAPRAKVAGADLSRIILIEAVRRRLSDGTFSDRGFTLYDISPLRDAINAAEDCVAVVIDPVGAFVGESDSYKESDVRSLLGPLAKLAAECDVAIVLIMHINRRAGAPASNRLMGSAGFANAARAVWLVAKDVTNPQRRLFLPVKMNIGKDHTGFAFTITSAPDARPDDPAVIAWEAAPVTVTADEAMAQSSDGKPGPDPELRDMAADWLGSELADLE